MPYKMNQRRFGWSKDPRDERDYVRGKIVYALPTRVDLSGVLPSVRDQGNLGSCTGFGIGGNLAGTAKQQNAFTEWFSPTWIYNGARLLEGCLGYDDGAYPRDCLEFLRANGSLLEHLHPYSDTLDTSAPTKWACAPEALKWPIVSYTRLVDGVDGIMGALASGHLISLGTPWYGSWSDTDANGILSDNYGSVAGGHEYLCYGYDSTLRLLYCQNSWGPSWGKSGRFAIRYSAIDAFKSDGGYDAHIVLVDWGEVVPPEPDPPEPDPDPDPVPDPTPSPPKFLRWLFIALGVVVIFAFVIHTLTK